jgi:hypothetical protein
MLIKPSVMEGKPVISLTKRFFTPAKVLMNMFMWRRLFFSASLPSSASIGHHHSSVRQTPLPLRAY